MSEGMLFDPAAMMDDDERVAVARKFLISAAGDMRGDSPRVSGPEDGRARRRARGLDKLASDLDGIEQGIPPFDQLRLDRARDLCREFVRVVISRGGEDVLDGPPDAEEELLAVAREILSAALD